MRRIIAIAVVVFLVGCGPPPKPNPEPVVSLTGSLSATISTVNSPQQLNLAGMIPPGRGAVEMTIAVCAVGNAFDLRYSGLEDAAPQFFKVATTSTACAGDADFSNATDAVVNLAAAGGQLMFLTALNAPTVNAHVKLSLIKFTLDQS